MRNLILLVFATMLLAACSKKENAAPNPKTLTATDLVGKWQITLDTTFNSSSGTLQQTVVDGTSLQAFLTFDKGNTGEISDQNDSGSMTYTVSQGFITIVQPNGDIISYDILSLVGNTMVVRFTISDTNYQDARLVKQQ